jgi:hypothetical protein
MVVTTMAIIVSDDIVVFPRAIVIGRVADFVDGGMVLVGKRPEVMIHGGNHRGHHCRERRHGDIFVSRRGWFPLCGGASCKCSQRRHQPCCATSEASACHIQPFLARM